MLERNEVGALFFSMYKLIWLTISILRGRRKLLGGYMAVLEEYDALLMVNNIGVLFLPMYKLIVLTFELREKTAKTQSVVTATHWCSMLQCVTACCSI